MYDITIIGASFAGLTLAHHLPKHYKILILDRKPKLNANFESTGLITEATRRLLADFVDVDKFIPNKITTIGVVSPDYDKYFFSNTDTPWIYSTDTPNLIAYMAETVPTNVQIKTDCNFESYKINKGEEFPVEVTFKNNGDIINVKTKFLIGADGAHSQLAKLNPNLSQNKKLLTGLEKVYYGNINFGPQPEATVYHFWFGKFSLGYGGWLSPTIINGQKAYRVGLAKLNKDIKDLNKLNDFIKILEEKNIINPQSESIHTFGSLIPIGGVLKNLNDDYTLLLGDAAGFCGAFAADGIKGAVLSGKIAAKLLPQYLNGNKTALSKLKIEIQNQKKLMAYYRKQQLYRWIWNQMKKDRTFHAMYDLIERQKDDFLNQFCDSKDNVKSLTQVILKIKNSPLLVKYSVFIIVDIFSGQK